MNVDLFTVEQASALWIDTDPASISPLQRFNPPEYEAIKQLLTGGIITGDLRADTSTNALHIIGNHSSSLVSRADLETFASKRNLFPAFLFDTLAPFRRQDSFAPLTQIGPTSAAIQQQPAHANRGGRPPQYDWDAFVMEIVRRANLPDGLPDRQADLVRDMLFWFQAKYDQEPAESAVKARISKIYKYLDEAKNSSH
ncbi:hypothetical protein [Mesorhizobium denitrificans]|uniref:ARS-binding protein 1 N-terminal domain-containing protein n=1 Tax=Mesorhizobium denitrificans TaxID=2294114 RepID=A0A371XJ23_9HYPH|nr:hypothetical protein [Mesorhizobium denitrificans]RFC69225.1 hypothetical protein DY251_00250 [Mesorhizobium denitrificans]